MIETFPSATLEDLAGMDPAGVLVLTVNNRHARRILAEMSLGLNATRSVMTVPDILPLSAWLKRAADQLSFVPESGQASHTVDSFGSQLLWQGIIDDAESDRLLLDVAQAARLAAEADRLLDEWRIEVQPEYATNDYLRFQIWRAGYQAKLADLDLEDGNLAYERIQAAVLNGLLPIEYETLVLAGFNEFSPRLSSILACLADQGMNIVTLESPAGAQSKAVRVAAPDPDGEWRLAAQWAADQLKQSPGGRFAIVAARLEADVALAHRYLRNALAGDEGGGKPTPYNVALARPMSDWPLARAALCWLRVLAQISQRGSCPPADLGKALLAGACVSDAQEAAGRAAIDALWRRRATIKVSSSDFATLLSQHAPRLSEAWQACMAECADDSAPAGADIWMARFRRWLQTLGFPGQAVMDSASFQQVEAFDSMMDVMARQAFVAGKLSFASAAALLGRLARETPFQPQRDPDARLDVLGFLESEGGHWDGIWVLGLTDEVLPAVPRPNPFIPLAALRQANAPRATPERELSWAKTMYTSLLGCAPAVWLSHALHEGERALRPSPCIAEVQAIELSLNIADAVACPMEYLSDDHGPSLQGGSTTRGGISVIDTQARNPLWAFVKYRLGASELPGYADLSDQNARGVFLHRAIELVWRLLPDQQALQDLAAAGNLSALLEQSVQQAADECLADYGGILRSLETERALSVLHGWLKLEMKREPFLIRDVEQTYEWSHGPLALTLRLDRIDEMHDGRLAVLDYKSGNGNIDPKPDWMRSRPVSLQLPFYASVLAQDSHKVAALVLARLHAREVQVKGLSDEDYGFEGLAALSDWPAFAGYSWDALMAEWRRTIENLADEYVSGLARNQSQQPDDLQYCDVLPFLRLNEEYKRVD